MSSGNSLQPTEYAKQRYNITQPVDFDVAMNYGGALMAIAGADGELSEAEFQWYVDEQERLMIDSQEHIEALRKFDWKNANIEELLNGIKYDLSSNFRSFLLYQAIKMSRADGIYHEKEKAGVAKAAQILGIDHSVVASLESLAENEDSPEMEESAKKLRQTIFETDV